MALLVFAATWLVYAATAGGTMATGDAVVMFEVAKSIVDRGSLDIPPGLADDGWRGVDGRSFAPFGIGQSLYDIPFVVAGRTLVRRTGLRLGDPDAVPKALVAGASTLPAAAAAAFGFLLAWRLSSDMRASLIAAFVIAFGTLLWPYARFGFNAALTTGALAAGVYGIAAGADTGSRRLLAGAGTALGVALLTRHEMTLAALACLTWLASPWRGADGHSPMSFSTRDAGVGLDGLPVGSRARLPPLQSTIVAAVPVGAAVFVSLTLNAVRFGHPLNSGHEPAFSFAGFGAYLVSPSASLVLYAPAAIAGAGLVALARRQALARLLLAVVIVMFVFYASLDDWLGTRSYGPRYLVPLLPLLVAPLAVWLAHANRRSTRAALAGLCIGSVLVQVPAVAVDFSRAGIAAGQPPQTVRRDQWQWSPLWVSARATGAAARSTVASFVSNRRDIPHQVEAASPVSARLPFGLDFWWVHLFQLGVLPRALAIAAALVPLAGAAGLARWAAREASADSPGISSTRDRRD